MEALALLLNIPPNKTLLRRHLATHFHLLIGSEAQRLKQECLENPDYSVLTATAKVKVTNECSSVTVVRPASVSHRIRLLTCCRTLYTLNSSWVSQLTHYNHFGLFIDDLLKEYSGTLFHLFRHVLLINVHYLWWCLDSICSFSVSKPALCWIIISFNLLQPRRLSFGGFGTLRKKRQDDGEEYVCPMNVEMPKSSSFQRGRVQIYEENLDHLEQVRRLASFILDFLKCQEVIWLMNEFLYFVGRWRTLRGRWGRLERFLRESTIWRWDTDLLLKIGFHPLNFLHPLCSSLCFRACWRTMSFSRRSPSALPRSTRQKRKTLEFESLWKKTRPTNLCSRTCEAFYSIFIFQKYSQSFHLYIYWSCPR